MWCDTNVGRRQTLRKVQTVLLQCKNDYSVDKNGMHIYMIIWDHYGKYIKCVNMVLSDIPADFANFMKVSSIVLSTALRAPGIRERATAMPPFSRSSLAPGWESSMLVRNNSNQVKYLDKHRDR